MRLQRFEAPLVIKGPRLEFVPATFTLYDGRHTGTVGVDLETGQQRFTFGSAQLIDGIDFIPIAIGLFGLGELFYAFYEGRHATGSGGIVQYQKERRFWPEARDWIETRVTLVRGSLLGFAAGVIPGAGATIASLMAYSVEKSASREPERFGKGAMAGLVGPEAAALGAALARAVDVIEGELAAEALETNAAEQRWG